VKISFTQLGSLAALLLALGFVDSANAQTSECRLGKPQQVAELIFGRKIGERIGVSNAAWARFVDREITPRFPDGFTIIDAMGQWRGQNGKRIIREPSKLVQIVLPGKDEDQQRLDEIVASYKARFRQQSVAIIVRPGCVAF
jgi:uncharacterized protein DUF3574